MVQPKNLYSPSEKIILGSWIFGNKHWTNVNDKESIELIHFANQEYGIKRIDTAPIYGNGHAETIIKQAISHNRDNYQIFSKCGLTINPKGISHNLSPKAIEEDLNQTLSRLGSDYLDILFFHWPDPKVPLEISLETAFKLQKKGKILAIGLSNFPAEEILKAKKAYNLEYVQIQYSLLNTNTYNNIQLLHNEGLKVFAYGTLHGGLLTTKAYENYPRAFPKSAKNFFYHHNDPLIKEKYFKLVKDLPPKKTFNLSAYAITETLKIKELNSIILGCRNIKQLNENLSNPY